MLPIRRQKVSSGGLTVSAIFANEVSVEPLVDDDFSVVHPHQLHTQSPFMIGNSDYPGLRSSWFQFSPGL